MLNNSAGFDVIGDIHGYASVLEILLVKMGYVKRDGVWRYPDRMAVFIGDYVDRGYENIRTCRIVMDMQEAGAALEIMGNHEFNHLAYDTPDPEKKRDGLFLGPQHVCVDASISKGGKLAAYRFSGESELSPNNLVFSCK